MRTRALALAAAALGAAFTAAAQNASVARWTEEARRFLVDCAPPPAGGSEAACSRGQAGFVADYVAAMRGDPAAQRTIGFMLTPVPRVPPWDDRAFVRQDPVQGCAWRLVVVEAAGPVRTTDMDARDLDRACGGLPPAELAAATARAGRILQEIGGKVAR